MLENMFKPYRRYFDFKGRSSRSEFWSHFLLWVLAYAVAAAMIFAGGASLEPGAPEPDSPLFYAGALIFGVFILGSFIPYLAVMVRRFHDQEKSGWFVLISFIPYIGGLIVLVFMCLEGTKGANKYGPDPLDPYDTGAFA